MKDQLKKYKIITQIPVQWADMDAAQHVNNLLYLRWGESSRILYFEKMKIGTSFKSRVGPILGWQDCKYIFPMTYPDTAIVGCRLLEIKEDRFILESAIFSKKHERIAALCKQHIIPYDYIDLKKAALPTIWTEAIENLEKI